MMTKPWFGPGRKMFFLKCENLRFLGLGFVISYLTSHFGQYKQGSPGRESRIAI